jgi:hypothetical protein
VTFGVDERIEHVGNLEIHVIGEPWYVRGQRTNPLKWSLVLRIAMLQCVMLTLIILGIFVGRNAAAMAANFSNIWANQGSLPIQPGADFLRGLLPAVEEQSDLLPASDESRTACPHGLEPA